MSSIGKFLLWLFLIIVCLTGILATFGISIIFMILALWAFNIDLKRENKASEDFRDGNLFFRYGKTLNETMFSIPIDPAWTNKEILAFVNTMEKEMKERSAVNLGSEGDIINQLIEVRDQQKRDDSKKFLKLNFRTQRGSELTQFIHYSVVGKSIVAHYSTHMRGTINSEDIARFVVFSPLSIWFWGFKWIKNQYSILTVISKYSENSFDLIDLSSFYQGSSYILFDQTREILKEHGLLSEELAQVIFNNINNSQNINVNDSNRVSIGDLTHNIQNTAKNLGLGSTS